MRTPNFTERLNMANAAKKAQLERARRIAEDPERTERLKGREEVIADRNRRIAERGAARRAAEEREAAELAARQAAEAAARQVTEEAQVRRLAMQAKREAAVAAEREAILAARRAGRKKKKRR